MNPRRRAIVSATGIVTAAGAGLGEFGKALARGESLAAESGFLATHTFPSPRVCEVRGLDPKKLARTPKDAKVLARASVLALAALADLREQAKPWPISDPWKSGLFVGVGLEQGDHRDMLAMLDASRKKNRMVLGRIATNGMGAMNPLSSLKTLPNMALAHIGIKLGDEAPRGANAAYSPFDAAGLEAIGAAAESVASGESDVAIAGAVDAPVSLFGLTTFHRLRVSSLDRPLGEAAALFVIETPERAREAGRVPLAQIEAWGSASDGAEPGATSAPTIAMAISEAMAWRGVKPDAIDGVTLSAGDIAAHQEALAAAGLKTARVDVVRTVFGETVAAGGALAFAAALVRIAEGAKRMLVSAGAFGGSSCAVLVRRLDE